MSNASDAIAEAFASDPENTAAFEGLEERYFVEGRWAPLADLYRARMTAPSVAADPKQGAALRFRLAQVLEERCVDINAAVDAYWSVAQLDPQHRGALRQLRRIHSAREQWDTALEIVELEVQIEMPSFERANLLAELGHLWREELKDAQQAESSFAKSLALDPQQHDSLGGMAQTLEDSGRIVEAAEYWQRLVDVQRGPDRACALVRLGSVVGKSLGDRDRAAECYRRALTDDPRCIEAVEALVTHAREHEQWSLFADLSERSFDLASGARRRTSIALEASRVQLERLGNPQTARLWLTRAADLSPEEAEIHRVSAEIERCAGNREALLDALEKWIRFSDAPLEASVSLEAAELCTEQGHDERALRHLRKAQSATPDDAATVDALASCLGRLGRHQEQIDALECRISLESDAEAKAELWVQVAQIAQELAGDDDSARQAWSQAFEACPARSDAAAEVIRLHTKAEDWPALRHALVRACEFGSQAERLSMLCSLGELHLARFDDGEAAAGVYRQALDLDPTEARALAGLARIAESSGDEGAMLDAYAREAGVTTDRSRLATLVWELTRLHEARDEREEALGWLERLQAANPDDRNCVEAIGRLHEELGNREELVVALERLETLSSGDAQSSTRKRLAFLCQELDRDEAAIRWAESSLDADPEQRDLVELLVGYYREDRRHADCARMQRRLAELLPPAEQRACLGDLAKLLEEQLGDLEGAVAILWRLTRSDPSDEPVAAHLSQLLDRAGRYEELVEQLAERRAQTAGDAAAWDLDLQRAGLLLDQLGNFDEAAEVFRSLHEREPADESAVEGYERALRAGHDIDGLSRLLAERAAAATDPRQRRRIEFERACLLEESLDQLDSAQSSYCELADQDDDLEVAADAAQRLERLLERAGDWVGLRQRLEITLGRADDNAAFDLRERLAALCRDRLNDADASIRHLEAALELRSGEARIWQQLSLLYEGSGSAESLLNSLEGELTCLPDSNREIALRARAGALCADRIDDAARARTHYERLLSLEPGNATAAEFLIDHYAEVGEHELLVELLVQRLHASRANTNAGDEETQRMRSQRTSLRLRIAEIRADALGDLDGAIDTLEDARAEEGPAAVVAQPLADLLRRGEHHDALVDLCQAVCDGDLTPGECAEWQMRLGDAMCATERNEQAVEAYRSVLLVRPEHEDAKTALRGLYRTLARPHPLSELLLDQIEHLDRNGESSDDPVPLHLELADLYTGPLSQPERALEQLRAVLAIDEHHAAAHERAIQLTEMLGLHDQQLELIDLRLAHKHAPDLRAALLERRGGVLADALDRRDEAIGSFREALSLEPERIGSRRALRAVYGDLGKWSAALDCLFVEARIAEGDERTALLEQGAQLAAQHLTSEAALPWLERLRAHASDDAEVIARIAAVHERAGRPDAQLRALEEQIERTPDAVARHALHKQCAEVLERDLEAPGRARSALRSAYEADPSDASVLRDLARLHEQLGDSAGQREALEALLPTLQAAERVEAHVVAARLAGDAMGEPRAARVHLEAALELASPTDPRRTVLLQSLADCLARLGDDAGWARVAEEALQLGLDESASRTLRQRLAETYEDRLGAPDAALRHWGQLAAQSDQDPQAVDAGERDAIDAALLRGLRRLRNPVELEARLCRWTERHPEDAQAWIELAHLRLDTLHSPGGAAKAFRAAVDNEGSSLDAIRGLRDTSMRLGAWRDVVAMLEREVQLLGEDRPECAPLLRQSADICHQRLDDPSRAASAYGRALQLDGTDLVALRSFQQLRESCEEYPQALHLYERECTLLGDSEPERRQECWLRAGELARDHTREPTRARKAYEAASAIGELPATRMREFAQLLAESGEADRHREVLAAWCDRDDSAARAADHLELADRLEASGEDRAARERTELATRAEPNCLDAWDALSRRAHSAGDALAAADALERAAQISMGREACRRYVAAALEIETAAPKRALAWLRLAVESDGGAAYAHAHRARLAEQCDEAREAEEAAARALDGPADGDEEAAAHMDDALWLEAMLVGGRTARARADRERASVFYGAALRLDPEHAESLSAYGELLFESGDAPAAREVLERRLAIAGEYAQRARHLGMVGEGHELAGRDEEALARFDEALQIDANEERAHEGAARIRERTGQVDDSVETLERWAGSAEDEGTRAEALARAGRIERSAGRLADAQAHLRLALEQDPTRSAIWIDLAEMLLDAGQADEALEAATCGLDHATDDTAARAGLAQIRAQVLETRDPAGAALAWGLVADSDPRNCKAALAEARLRRQTGNWREAADGLGRFAQRHPEPNSIELAAVYEECGRLLAGPLEEVEEAVEAYERSLALDPNRIEARHKLASLLALAPGRVRDSIAAHRELLKRDPTAAASLRSLLGIAQKAGSESCVLSGLGILRALGIASPEERERASTGLRFAMALEPSLDDRIGEAMRLAVREASEEIAGLVPAPKSSARGSFHEAIDHAQDDLSSPGVRALHATARREALRALAALVIDPRHPYADTALAAKLDRSVGRRTLRRVKKHLEGLTLPDVAACDIDAWYRELRALATAVALDRKGGDLRAALDALIAEEHSMATPEPEADVTALVAASPSACTLLSRVVTTWCERIAREL